MRRLLKAFRSPKKALIVILMNKKIAHVIPDRLYLKWVYRLKTGKKLDLKNPEEFNEKMQWLKLYNRKPEYTELVDKYEMRKYVSRTIGDEHLMPLLGVWDKLDDIPFESFPEQFVLKCTHDSGGLFICRDKSSFDIDKAREKITRSLAREYFYLGREWPYKNIKPRIIAEKYLENGDEGLHDYKVWCFNGKPRLVQYMSGRLHKTYDAFYDTDWNRVDTTHAYETLYGNAKKPECLEKLLELSEKLAKDIPFARTDFYILEDGRILAGEITLFPSAGFKDFVPDEMNKKLGEMIDLSCVERT